MNLATLISFGAALLQLSFGTLFLLISRANRWERGRLFAILAFSAAAYSATNSLFTMPGVDERTLRALGPLNYLFGAIHCAGWLIYAHGVPERPWRGLPPRLRVIVVGTVLLGVVAQLPGAINAPGLLVVEPGLGIVYHQPQATPYAAIVGAWLLVVLGMAFVCFIGNLRAGLEGARVQIAGFAVFFACAAVEVLVTNGAFTFIYPADIGFLAVVMVVLVETMRGVLSDARTLEAIGRDLAAQVAQRTRQLDVANDALAHAARLAAVGQLAAGVGHEINNPLTVLQVNLEQLRDQARGHGRPDVALVGEALEGVHRIARVVADLRSYALPAHEHRETVNVASVIESARKLASHRLRHVAPVDEQLAALAPVRVDAVRLELDSEPGRGTTARVILPTCGAVPPPPPPASLALPAVPRPGARRALVIDDEPMIVRSIARHLATSYEVTTCLQPADALALLQSDAHFDIVLCDLMMPGMSGAELHAALADARHDRLARMLFMTGGAVTAHTQGFLADPSIRHVLKPFTRAELVEAIAEVRDAADAADADADDAAPARRIAV